MLRSSRVIIGGWLVALMTLANPSLANAHPPSNDWIIFLLLWYLFGAGQGGFPVGPGGCCCLPGGPQPAPNGNGGRGVPNGNGAPAVPNGNGNGVLLRNGGGHHVMPGQPQMVPALWQQQARPNGMVPQLRNQVPLAPGPAMHRPGHHMNKPAAAKAVNGAVQPKGGGNKPAAGGPPLMGGKPAVGGKPQFGGKPLVGPKR